VNLETRLPAPRLQSSPLRCTLMRPLAVVTLASVAYAAASMWYCSVLPTRNTAFCLPGHGLYPGPASAVHFLCCLCTGVAAVASWALHTADPPAA
jgi:hypothetical protein